MANVTFYDALELFELDNQQRGLTKQTKKFYKEKLGSFGKFLDSQNISAIDKITSTVIKQYLIHLQESGLNDTSQHDYARALKTFCNFLVREELLEKSPFQKVKMPQVSDKLPVVLTEAEIKQVLERTRDTRNKLIVRFILDSGVRASELLALNVGDVDFSTGIVTVRHGKQQKDRYTSIGATTRKELKKYLIQRKNHNTDSPLFAHLDTEERLQIPSLMSMFRNLRKQTSVENLTAHTLRRTMVTLNLENGIDSYILSRMLGHADLQMLRKYAAISKKHIQKQGQKYSVIDNL